MQFLVRGNRILDVGCGPGKNIELLKNKELYGIDISEENIKIAKSKGYKDAACLDISLQGIPYPDAFFDSAICMELMEHLFDPIHALSEINRVLKPNGRIIISIPNIGWIFPRIALLFGIFCDFCDFQLIPCHIRFFTITRLKRILSRTGFKVERIYGTTDFVSRIPFKRGFDLLSKVYPALFSSNPVFLAKKSFRPLLNENSYSQISGALDGIKRLVEYH